MAKQAMRMDNQACYILHSKPQTETSLLVDVFSQQHGYLQVLARGARTQRSELRGQLYPFQPLLLSWFGKGFIRSLHKAEWQGGVRPLSGQSLVTGFYLNELLLRLLQKDIALPDVWQAYDTAIRSLSQNEAVEPTLRCFEWRLLTSLGYAPDLYLDECNGQVDPLCRYEIKLESMPRKVSSTTVDNQHSIYLSGESLLKIHRLEFDSTQALSDAKRLMRFYLAPLLGAEGLYTRQLYR